MDEKFAKRFWGGVDKSGGDTACWPWSRGRQPNGYGHTSSGPRSKLLTHRVAWALTYGAPLTFAGHKAEACVCHKCDNRLCCNPAHLFLGTQADNMRDMAAKGRQRGPKGEGHHLARLSAQDIADMRFARSYSGASYAAIAKAYSVSRTAAARAIKGISYPVPQGPMMGA